MKCDCCHRVITPVEAEQAAEISPISVTLCVFCAESIAAADNDEGDDWTDGDSKNPADPS